MDINGQLCPEYFQKGPVWSGPVGPVGPVPVGLVGPVSPVDPIDYLEMYRPLVPHFYKL